MPEQPWVMVTILGVGRSGTSAITRGLQAIGVDLGDNLRKGSGKNPTGFFEDNDFLVFSKRLKRAFGLRADSVRLIEDREYQSRELDALADDVVALVRRRFGDKPIWGYKYARTLRFLPFWEKVYQRLGLEVRYVFALRNPLSVAISRGRLDPHRGTQEKSDLEWLINVVPYFERTRDDFVLVVDYDLVMAEPAAQLERMARALGLPLDEKCREGIAEYRDRYLKPGIRHSRFTIEELDANASIHPLARRAYHWLYDLAVDQASFQDASRWQEWSAIADGVRELAPLLRHCDRLEAELRATQRSLWGPLQAIPPLWRNWRAR